MPALHRLLASIDDAGDYVLLLGDSIGVGHRAAGRACLEFLGDLEAEHAVFELATSFHGGEGWSLRAAIGVAPPRVDGEELAPGSSRPLFDGDEVYLGTSAAFFVRKPDDSSSSLVLDLARGTDCHGARRIALVGLGEAARIRVGRNRRRHVPVVGLGHDIDMVARRDRLDLRCDGGVRLAGTPADGAVELAIPLPLTGRIDVATGAAPDRLPPFGVALRPLAK